MKCLSLVAAVVGVVLVLMAFYGRFHGATTIALFGQNFSATSFLVTANTAFLVAILLRLRGTNHH